MATAIAAMAAMVVLAAAAIVVPIAAGGSDLDAPTPLTPRGDVPALAVEMWPWLHETVATQCPEMDVAWLGALIEVESSWDPEAVNSDTAASGLLQALRASWLDAASGDEADGWPDAAGPPTADWPGWDPQRHLKVMVPWMCANLQYAADVISQRGLGLDAHVGAAVCHVAGCSRLTDSQSGVPQPGEANCDADCSVDVHVYVERIDQLRGDYAAIRPASAGTADVPAAAPAGRIGCVLPDPTGTGGCVTPRTAHLVEQLEQSYGTDRRMWCWARRPGNPSSDHPRGRACDITIGEIGDFPSKAERQAGWQIAAWLVEHADQLAIRYVIWDGRWWTGSAGWRPYTGGGVYNPSSATGGHYDHLHASVEA